MAAYSSGSVSGSIGTGIIQFGFTPRLRAERVQSLIDHMSETAARPEDQELVATLFELGREVASVLDFDELLRRIPRLIARLTSFTVFSVYLLDEKRQDLKIGYAEGYPEEIVRNFRLKLGQGIVGTAVAE